VSRSEHELAAVRDEIAARGGNALAVPADLTDPSGAVLAVRTAEDELGPVDLLVNSAGIGRAHGPIWGGDPARWCDDVDTNLRMTVLPTHAVVAGMVTRGRGRIVTVSSRRARQLTSFPLADRQPANAVANSSYVVAKGAVLMFMEQLAVEVLPQGVVALSIAPGRVRTRLTDDLAATGGADPETWLPWQDDGGHAAALTMRIATGDLDHLAGGLVSVFDDVDALEPWLRLPEAPPAP
jgi:NAD(P)-dependent dehydrogenase (short-subunit alcohol dehydrogenase family)